MAQEVLYIYDFMLGSGLKLKGCALLLYARIYRYTINGQEMFESEETLSRWMDFTREVVGRNLRKLTAAGLIIRREYRHNPGRTCAFVTNLDYLKREKISHPNGRKSHISMGDNLTFECDKKSHNNKRDRIEDNNINIHGKQYSLFPNAKIPALEGPDSGGRP